VRDASVVVCGMFFARAVWVGFSGDSPQPARAREKALAPIPITLLTRFIAVSYVETMIGTLRILLASALPDDCFAP
jgi:hypothetical protein